MSATPTTVSYTTWSPPGALYPIRYPLALFREIDFFVGEGYRRIPHGGLEVGAVLYGHGVPSGTTIRAFRPIESQHSFGPSFTLSPSDLERLGKQVSTPLITEAGEELEVVGWLISNCRSDLVLTDQESRIYDEYFPGPRQVTLLAKPEKLKPTRYGFLVHPPRGRLVEKACRDSFILPLSTKGDATAVRETAEATPAPQASLDTASAGLPEIPVREVQPLVPAPPPAAAVTPVPVAPEPQTPTLPDASATPGPVSVLREDLLSEPAHRLPDPDFAAVVPSPPVPTPPPEPVEPEPTEPLDSTSESVPPVVPLAPVPEVTVEPLATKANDSPNPLPASAPQEERPTQPMIAAVPSATVPAEMTENVTEPVRERTPERSPESLPVVRGSVLFLQPEPPRNQILPEGPIERLRERRQPRNGAPWRDIGLGVAIMAVLSAGAVWTYLHLPPPPIPLNAEVQPSQVVVTWPPELTKNADRCSITTWINGQPSSQALSADEQSEGKAIIQTDSPDVTIQIHALHWYQEQFGQIRVFRITPAPLPPSILTSPSRRVFAPPPGGSPVPPLVGRPADPVPQKPPQ